MDVLIAILSTLDIPAAVSVSFQVIANSRGPIDDYNQLTLGVKQSGIAGAYS